MELPQTFGKILGVKFSPWLLSRTRFGIRSLCSTFGYSVVLLSIGVILKFNHDEVYHELFLNQTGPSTQSN